MLLVTLMTLGSCNKFLNVEPLDSLSGNNFWKTKEDVETFTRDIYRLFREGVGTTKPLILMADMRTAPVKATAYPPRGDFNHLANNDLKRLISTPRRQGDIETWWQAYTEWDVMSDWTPLYKIIQAANILYEEAPKVMETDKELSPAIVKQYQAEAVFMRSVTYFFLIRLFGDVPYYTNAYNQEPLGRMSHVEVAKRCLEDLEAIKDDLPWTYPDPANRGVRAMKGAALALQMHLNMWLAGFDGANKASYYHEVDRQGTELIEVGEKAMGAYKLSSIEDLPLVFAGRTREGLFEIPQNVNYGDRLQSRNKVLYTSMLHYPYFDQHADPTKSEVAFDSEYLKRIYPEDNSDKRVDIWFDENMYSFTGEFNYFKFFNFAEGTANTIESISNYFIIFRLADVILLQAEALAELGEDARAAELLNRIRARAEAPLFPAEPGEGNLKDAIFWERCKELMAEGHYFYDMVRTGKVYDPNYSYKPISYSDFVRGAWTWPINAKATTNNNNMTFNEFWR